MLKLSTSLYAYTEQTAQKLSLLSHEDRLYISGYIDALVKRFQTEYANNPCADKRATETKCRPITTG